MRKRTILAVFLIAALRLAAGGQETSVPPPLNLFEGQILDAEGKPVEGASVAVADALEGYIFYQGPDTIQSYAPDEKVLFFFKKRNGARSGTTRTDAQGVFRLQGLKAGSYSVLAVHRERGLEVVKSAEQPNPGKPLRVTLKAPAFLEVEVRGLEGEDKVGLPEGRPFMLRRDPADTQWLAEAQAGSRIFLQPTLEPDAEGKYRSGPLLAGGWVLEKDRYVLRRSFQATILSLPLEVEAGKTRKLVVDLTQGSSLAGEVRGPKGEALEEVAVTATFKDPSGKGAALVHGALTDGQGRYVIRGLKEGPWLVEAKRHAPRTGPG